MDRFPFDLLVSDILPVIFAWLDPSSLASVACVCQKWCEAARKARGPETRFRLILAELVANPKLFAWWDEKRPLPTPLHTKPCATAAKYGMLAGLQWLRNSDYPWDARTCASPIGDAALGGHLSVLQWARKNGCEWDRRVHKSMARFGPSFLVGSSLGLLLGLDPCRDIFVVADARKAKALVKKAHAAVIAHFNKQTRPPYDHAAFL